MSKTVYSLVICRRSLTFLLRFRSFNSPPSLFTKRYPLTSSPRPVLSIYVMPARFITIFLRLFPRFSRTRSRSKALPSPRVIRPSMSITVTASISGLVALKLMPSFSPLIIFHRSRLRRTGRSAGSSPFVMLGHDEFGATGFAGMHIDLIHEGLHQKHASSGIFEDILVLSRIG